MELVALNVNGRTYNIAVEKNWTLLYTLREVMDLTGTKCGCSTGDCGSCKVIIDGEAVNSCSVRAMDMGGKAIETIEGISPGHVSLHPIQQAFIDCGAVQCGFCTPGLIMSAVEIVGTGKKYNREELKKLISGHLCRCTGYENILNAMERIVEEVYRTTHKEEATD